MGYVAVVTDDDEVRRLGRRDIVIAWRGTVTYLEWIHDLKDILHPACFSDDPSIKIESGLHALALLSAYDIAEMKLNFTNTMKRIPITVFSFSGPRVGNLKFKERRENLGIKVLRVVNVQDKVPKVPGVFANEKNKHQKYIEEKTSFPWSYAHVGTELELDHFNSPFLKPTKDISNAHNLEALLHLVDGYVGRGLEFCSATARDIALVNKSCDFLKDEYGVPAYWRQDENKGMVRSNDGRWILPERPRLDSHPPDTAYHLEQVLKFAAENTLKAV
ncbi:alpha/beta-Hydrolases superfamily protein [Artemisia annua]|uniref:Alpha/beta-Hydrolases superfamily protein n=1 Tax=Artemisia annua TaxID=35608 RepID=A0A2U1QLK4_ARTAN|nr:alpha/beta-Hydrolases superfamily protein [Artemisia annua]